MTGKPKLSEADFVRLFEELGPAALGRKIGLVVHKIHSRRRSIERRRNIVIRSPIAPHSGARRDIEYSQHPGRIETELINGIVLVGSDAHYWPGSPSTAHRAFVHFCRQLRPSAVILNGDVIDAAAISRHPPIGWEKQPTVQEEIEAAQERLHEIIVAAGKARKIWTLGNHDGRFETRLAMVAPEFAKVRGVHLRDHFPLWEPCWSVWINDCVVKHRFKGGIHATHNNTLWAGKSIISGHLHSAKVTPFSDYNGTRYGVDTGCLASVEHRAFLDYTEDNPKNWRSAFAVLTFRDRKLMMPELVVQWDEEHVEFRSEIIKV